MPIDALHSCRRCAAPLAIQGRCGDCPKLPSALSRIVAPYEYGGALADALLRLKWQGRDDLGRPLGQLLGPLLRARAGSFDVLVPVPLHPRRLRERGFNQATLLARAAHKSAQLGELPLLPSVLRRMGSDPPARAASRTARFSRTRGAFVVRDPRRIAGKRVLLVDDVVTTGATALACATALVDAGALRVEALALLRAS